MVIVDGYQYEVMENVREGFKDEEFLARYSDILSKYDYICIIGTDVWRRVCLLRVMQRTSTAYQKKLAYQKKKFSH